ncbi:diguanylate cyclase [Vibrio sonorensis]|uniref:diguanylate cyclase n=1 Tax=Vibrio sonorensis TaxID=1004316 RepID=UPI0008DAF121|nr:diguanylate cyclase [Vibrio sonorensis]
MTHFVGRHLEEMADIRSSRKRKIVLLCSLVSILVMGSYGLIHFAAASYPFSALNLICTLILAINLWYMYKSASHHHADLVLSGVLLFDAIVLLLYGEQIPDRLLWLFPIVAAVIFINEFKIGLVFSGAFCLLAAFSTLFTNAILVPAYMSTDRFVISLFAMAVLCNTFSYYYAKVVNYIQSLYQEGIEDLAYLDQLTGLANRWSFENWALEKLSEVEGHSGITALVFLDIDDFKSINDTYGHDVGDRVLQHFSKRLKNNIRSKDRRTEKHDYSIARFAGDEFVLLLYDVRSRSDLDNILDRICHLFEHSYQASERVNRLTISVGVALYPEDADSLPELTRCADKAMYAAKHGGKNQYRYYQGDRLSPLKDLDINLSDKVTPIKKA